MNYELVMHRVELVLYYKGQGVVVWRTRDEINTLKISNSHDEFGFLNMDCYVGGWASIASEFYIAHEKELKEHARKIIVKEML